MRFRYLCLLAVVIVFAIGFFAYFSFFKTPKTNTVVAALDKEVIQQLLTHEGKIPEWLSGTFVRNGPVWVQINGQKLEHWFDGPAMLHAFSFQAGKVLYSNKFLRTQVYQKIFKQGSLNYSGFATEPHHSWFEKLKIFFTPRSNSNSLVNANVNVVTIAGQTVALTETPLPVRFDIKTLDTLGDLVFQDNLPKKDIFESAHPQYDPQAEEKINYLVDYGRQSKYVLYRYNPKEAKREVIAEVGVEKPAYMHSFAITEHYIVLVEFPLRVDPLDLMIMSKPFIKNFNWYPEQGTNFIVVNRKTGKQVKAIKYSKPFFAFHHVNAFEKDENIILDLVTYPDAGIVFKAGDEPVSAINTEVQNKTSIIPTQLVRFTLSLKEDRVEENVILNAKLEFPRINEKLNAHAYRYIYAVDPNLLAQETDLRPLYKIDTLSHKTLLWQEPGMTPGEPVFIAKPGSTEEDEGVVITIVMDVLKQKAFLLVLDAQTFKELGRAYAPHIIPEGLHGQYF